MMVVDTKVLGTIPCEKGPQNIRCFVVQEKSTIDFKAE